jgi:hypothetical protein
MVLEQKIHNFYQGIPDIEIAAMKVLNECLMFEELHIT